jgi:hypothetical protein
MAYARLNALRENLDHADGSALGLLCTDFNRALDDLRAAGFDLSAFKLDDEDVVEDRNVALRAQLNAVLDYFDLMAGLP